MRKLLLAVWMFLLTAGLWAQSPSPATDDAAQPQQEIDQLKKTVNALEQRLDAQQKTAQPTAAQPAEKINSALWNLAMTRPPLSVSMFRNYCQHRMVPPYQTVTCNT